jgi:hypothetical protein
MEQISELGKIAGIGGIALGVLLFVFRDAVAPHIARLSKQRAYALLQSIVVLSFTVAVAGIGAWVWTETHPKTDLAAEARRECLLAAAATAARGDGPEAAIVSAGGNIQAQGDIRVEGAEKLGRPAVSADCGDVSAGSIEIQAGAEDAPASEQTQ